MNARRPRVAVYCASRQGSDPAFMDTATRVGSLLARRNADVVFGGASVGLMGAVADAAIAGGCHVIGVLPNQMADREFAHPSLSELWMVDGMTARKAAMYDSADVFLALPGGIGTMEELFEVLSWASLGLHPKPVGLLDVNGYYGHLLAFLDHSVSVGLMKPAARELLLHDDDAERLMERLLDTAAELSP